ncbi:hypothetical protein LTR62_003706 [Meristemomyces frigidus]|uniref:Glucose-methanol-choline oxidoreductase N-terminal domain-containing protein n=1 Tax=Meristemomyces frigidus TaxID=1508187 RepID=A0AAN7TRM9_9PEZI|nr:hypothetical protein LTR62_003706 [Meristemomyces frigidus]
MVLATSLALSLALSCLTVSASLWRPNWLVGSNFGVAGANASFDYVIVGGGTAGLTLATRLAQNGSFSVAIVEAGGFYELENGNVSQIPAFAFMSTQEHTLEGVNPLIDWRFETTPQAGVGNQSYHYARGKTLGGSSARNYLNFNRPTVGTMQKWADMVSDDSYLWDNVLPLYKKSVHFTPPNKETVPQNATISYDSNAWSVDGGPLEVSYPNYLYAAGSWAAKAFAELGVPSIPGFNNGCLLGSAYTAHTLDPVSETRSTSQTAFLTLATQGTNLIVYTHTLAKRILFDDAKKATGVLVQAGGVAFTLTANKEVISSAGAFQSPQLLMVSGVGPSSTLRAHNIPIIADRPGVGQNMWDNIIVGVTYEVNLETTAIYANPTLYPEVIQSYLYNHTGPLTNVGSDYISYEKLSTNLTNSLSNSTRHRLAAEFPPDWPEIEYIIGSTFFAGAPDAKNYLSIAPGLLACLSRGNISISSSDMADAPLINPNWLTDPADQEVIIAAIRRSRDFFNTAAMKHIILGPELSPGANITTDAEILAWLQTGILETLYHAAGTCAMGKVGDEMAVVDSKARVIGVTGLRVVDVSAFPFLPPGQPQASVYMLAEKIGEDILRGL